MNPGLESVTFWCLLLLLVTQGAPLALAVATYYVQDRKESRCFWDSQRSPPCETSGQCALLWLLWCSLWGSFDHWFKKWNYLSVWIYVYGSVWWMMYFPFLDKVWICLKTGHHLVKILFEKYNQPLGRPRLELVDLRCWNLSTAVLSFTTQRAGKLFRWACKWAKNRVCCPAFPWSKRQWIRTRWTWPGSLVRDSLMGWNTQLPAAGHLPCPMSWWLCGCLCGCLGRWLVEITGESDLWDGHILIGFINFGGEKGGILWRLPTNYSVIPAWFFQIPWEIPERFDCTLKSQSCSSKRTYLLWLVRFFLGTQTIVVSDNWSANRGILAPRHQLRVCGHH